MSELSNASQEHVGGEIGGSQNLLNAVLHTTNDAILLIDNTGLIALWNDGAERIFGYSSIDAVGRPSSLIIPDNNLQEQHGKEIKQLEIVGLHKSGQQIHLSLNATPVTNEQGDVAGTLLVFKEVINARLATQKQATLAAIVGSSDDTIVSKTLEGNIISWNNAAERMFGYTETEALGKHISIIIPPERIDEETYIISQVREGNRVDHFETIRVAKDGRLIPISLSVSPIVNEQGEIIGASKIARDISDQVAVQQEKAKL